MTNTNFSTRKIVAIALFAALVTIATTIRIPLPALVGQPFIHLGSSVFILAVLLLGVIPGAIAGSLGFVIFDVLNGFAAEAPYFILECFIIAGILSLVLRSTQFAKQPTTPKLILLTVVAGIAKLGMTFLKNTVMALVLGATVPVAVTSSISALYITLINAIAAVIIVSLLYFPLRTILDRTLGK